MHKYGSLIVAVALAAACGGPPAGARRAQRLLNAGEYDEAERVADAELARFPRQPILWRVKIQAAMGRRDPARAVEIYGQWKELRGTHDRKAVEAMALTTLWQGLYTPSAKVKIAAIQTAERLDLAPLAEPVAERMGDDDTAVIAAAAVALLRSHPDAPIVATQALSSDNPHARAIAVEGIARKVGAAARGDLAPLLKDPSPRVRRAAVQGIWKFATSEDVAAFAALARRDDDGSVRAAALDALGNKDFPGAVETARKSLHDAYLGARLAALRVLTKRGKAIGDDLTVLAAGDDLFLALRAAVELANRGDKQRTLRVAERALASEEWTARAAALNAIAEVADKEPGLALARAATRDAKVGVRLAAARALVRLGDREGARAVFADALAGNDDGTRVQAAIDLVRLGDTRGRDALGELARAASPDTRERAVRALLQLGEPSDALVAALADESAEVRILAADVALTLLHD